MDKGHLKSLGTKINFLRPFCHDVALKSSLFIAAKKGIEMRGKFKDLLDSLESLSVLHRICHKDINITDTKDH